MTVRKLSNAETMSLRDSFRAREEAELALKRAIAALPEQQSLADAKRAFKMKCGEVSQDDETFSDDFEYAVAGVIRKEKK